MPPYWLNVPTTARPWLCLSGGKLLRGQADWHKIPLVIASLRLREQRSSRRSRSCHALMGETSAMSEPNTPAEQEVWDFASD